MDDLSEKTVFELADRMNQIEREIIELELEYNRVVHAIKEQLPKLKDDVNLQPKVLRKVLDE